MERVATTRCGRLSCGTREVGASDPEIRGASVSTDESMSLQPELAIVAIVGRPNVGKSRLFNRYAGHRRALVEDTPGVTRDRIAEEISVENRAILLVDTAGLDPDPTSELSAAIQAQARSAVEEADAILFVVDGQAGLLPEDEEIARTLRRANKPLAVVVNKIDIPGHLERMGEFYGLGLAPLRAVSAEHGRGAFDALEELVRAIPPSPLESAPLDTPARQVSDPGLDEIRVAIVGRPNVGKSSLFNRLLGEERVVVSSVPGTTRDSVDLGLEVDGQRFVLVDTAGLRRPGKRRGAVERVSALMTVKSLDRAQMALLLIDAPEGFTEQDAHVASAIRDRGCGIVVLANKWDLVRSDDGKRILEQIRHGLRFLSDAPILSVSAKTGARVGRLFGAVRQVARSGGRRIATAELNRWLQETVRLHEPPMARRGQNRRPIKFFYGTQTEVYPPTFLFFCSNPDAIAASYRRFLENRLREVFDFKGTPLRLRLRARPKGQEL
jgi:GTP-binding protein